MGHAVQEQFVLTLHFFVVADMNLSTVANASSRLVGGS